MDNFRQMIEGKKVLLLGPATYLYDGNYKEDLNDYDVVIKMNRMVETDICKEFINDRCDILYHCLDISPQYGNYKYDLKKIKNASVDLIRIPYPPVSHWYKKTISFFLNENKNLLPYSIVENDLYFFIYNGCNRTSPNTGVIAIFDILDKKPNSLTIKGITFFKNGYNKNYRDKINTEKEVEDLNKKVNNHNTNNQRIFVANEIKKYSNLFYDENFIKGLQIK